MGTKISRLIFLALAATLVAGCAVNLPPGPALDPANANAPGAAPPPSRASLLATSRNFASPAADDREQASKEMNMSQMKHGENMHTMQPPMAGTTHPSPTPDSSEAYYTCVMHPQIHEAKPGQCPICGMTLVRKPAAPEGGKP